MAYKASTTRRSRKPKSAAQIAAAKKNLEKARAARSRKAKVVNPKSNQDGHVYSEGRLTKNLGSSITFYKQATIKNGAFKGGLSGHEMASVYSRGKNESGKTEYYVSYRGARGSGSRNKFGFTSLAEAKSFAQSVALKGSVAPKPKRRRRRTTTAKK